MKNSDAQSCQESSSCEMTYRFQLPLFARVECNKMANISGGSKDKHLNRITAIKSRLALAKLSSINSISIWLLPLGEMECGAPECSVNGREWMFVHKQARGEYVRVERNWITKMKNSSANGVSIYSGTYAMNLIAEILSRMRPTTQVVYE